jgi:hypothetical protein
MNLFFSSFFQRKVQTDVACARQKREFVVLHSSSPHSLTHTTQHTTHLLFSSHRKCASSSSSAHSSQFVFFFWSVLCHTHTQSLQNRSHYSEPQESIEYQSNTHTSTLKTTFQFFFFLFPQKAKKNMSRHISATDVLFLLCTSALIVRQKVNKEDPAILTILKDPKQRRDLKTLEHRVANMSLEDCWTFWVDVRRLQTAMSEQDFMKHTQKMGTCRTLKAITPLVLSRSLSLFLSIL